MRQEELTTKLQEALSDAQSLAVGNDNQYIEPVHLLTALLNQDDGGARSLLQRAGVNAGALTTALKSALERLPKVSGTSGETQAGRELMSVLNLADKEAQKRGDQFVSSEMILLALNDDKSDAGKLAREAGLSRQQQIENPLSKLILSGEFGVKDTIALDVEAGRLVFTKPNLEALADVAAG